MKSIIFYPALLLISILFTTCLKMREEGPTLPPVTMEGKNTMGCIINGEVFTVSGKTSGWPYYGTYALYISGSSSGVHPPEIFIKAKQRSPEVSVSVNLGLYEGQNVYELNKKELSVGKVRMWVDDHIFADTHFTTNNEYKGWVEILKFVFDYETGEGIVSGLFEFDAIDSRGEVIEVREGRFDLSFGR